MALLASAAFLSSAGARVVDALLAPIATEFGTGVPEVAIIIAAFTIPYGANQILLGPLGDRVGKLRLMTHALAAYAAACIGCAFAPDLPALTVARVVAGAASAGLIPVGIAFIADNFDYGERQVAISRLLTGVVLAQMAAGPLGGAFGQFAGWRSVFLLLAAMALATSICLAIQQRGQPAAARRAVQFDFGRYVWLATNPLARWLLVGTLIDGALFSGSFPFIAPYLNVRMGLSYLEVGLLLAFFGFGMAIYTAAVRPLIARLGERRLVATGAALAASGMALTVPAASWLWFPPIEIALGLGYFMLHGVLQARATEMLPEARGTAVAAFALALFSGQAIGALLMGLGIATLGYRASFAFDAGGIAMLGLWLRSRVQIRAK